MIIGPEQNSLAQWHQAVSEAQVIKAIHLGEDLESYVVFLLMRYVDQIDLIRTILAKDYLISAHANGNNKTGLLQVVGDKCLLLSGLFPEYRPGTTTSESYLIELGQSAYLNLHHEYERKRAYEEFIFELLSEKFLCAREILIGIRELGDYQFLNATEAILEQIKKTQRTNK